MGKVVVENQAWMPRPKYASWWVCSGREALALLCNILSLGDSDEVLLPSYLCLEALRPFLQARVRVRFYPVSQSLRISARTVAERISSRTKLVLLVHYFGLPLPLRLFRELRSLQPAVAIVEDCVQAGLSFNAEGRLVGQDGDFSIFSYRKLLPLPDGGVLFANIPSRSVQLNNDWPWRWGFLACRLAGMTLKSVYERHPAAMRKICFRNWLLQADRILAKHPVLGSASFWSRRLLWRISIEKAWAQRRWNFLYLLNSLLSDPDAFAVRPLYRSLPDGACPLGFPLLAQDRDGIRIRLIQQGVYPPIHWELPAVIDRHEFSEAHALAARIMTLPIDQRYGKDDIDRMLRLLRKPGDRIWPVGMQLGKPSIKSTTGVDIPQKS